MEAGGGRGREERDSETKEAHPPAGCSPHWHLLFCRSRIKANYRRTSPPLPPPSGEVYPRVYLRGISTGIKFYAQWTRNKTPYIPGAKIAFNAIPLLLETPPRCTTRCAWLRAPWQEVSGRNPGYIKCATPRREVKPPKRDSIPKSLFRRDSEPGAAVRRRQIILIIYD